MKKFVDKLISRLGNHIKYCESCHEEFSNAKMSLTYEVQLNAYKSAIEIVNELAEEYNNGWIPCSKELPNDLEDETILYEVTVAVDICGKVNYVTDYAIFFDNNWKSATWTKQGGKVIAWKERTKPYIPEK